jgi:hypothetical protein
VRAFAALVMRLIRALHGMTPAFCGPRSILNDVEGVKGRSPIRDQVSENAAESATSAADPGRPRLPRPSHRRPPDPGPPNHPSSSSSDRLHTPGKQPKTPSGFRSRDSYVFRL